MRKPTLIIAEAGVNHNGSLAMAKMLIDAAAEAGADLVKFQSFKSEQLAAAIAQKADYQIRNSGNTESQREMLSRLELSDEDHFQLIEHCRTRNIGFFSTAFDLQSLNLLIELGFERYKVPSGEITNLPYLRRIGELGKPVILSTGMSTLGDIEAALSVLEVAGLPRSHVTVLHCTTEYPTPMKNVNLLAMQAIQRAFNVEVGYSDHTNGIEVAIAAVALGASVIEKHFTLDRSLPGPDHLASLEPRELAQMVAAIRNIEVALGDGVKRLSTVELSNRTVARKSLVAMCPIRAGDYFSTENITVKRPGTGISPMDWDVVIGRKAPRDFAPDEEICL